MSDRNILKIGLVVEGLQHLKKFAAAVGYDGPIEGPYQSSDLSVKDKYTNALYHPKFASDLKNKGVVPRKTWCVEFSHWLDKELLPHFIRGWYDGHGIISKKTTKYKDKVYETASFGGCGAVR